MLSSSREQANFRGLEAKDLTFEAKAKDFKMCPRGLHLWYRVISCFLVNEVDCFSLVILNNFVVAEAGIVFNFLLNLNKNELRALIKLFL